mmetsp:Transcript_3088/g.8721  ORF Transcript_3088/g.8721 Transcript_3088/m.8721 type:complete len:102 (-) Transcript_3088:907-1212(-)
MTIGFSWSGKASLPPRIVDLIAAAEVVHSQTPRLFLSSKHFASENFQWLLPTISATQRYKCPCQYWEDVPYTYYFLQIPEPYSGYRCVRWTCVGLGCELAV